MPRNPSDEFRDLQHDVLVAHALRLLTSDQTPAALVSEARAFLARGRFDERRLREQVSLLRPEDLATLAAMLRRAVPSPDPEPRG